MISLPGMLWVCVGSLHMLEYKETKLLTSSQEMVLFKSLFDMSQLSESLGRI